MAAYATRARWFGWANVAGSLPTAERAPLVVGNDVSILFTEQLRPGAAASQFTATVGGSARTVSGITIAGRELRVTLAAPALTAGQAVVITYAKSGTAGLRLADIFGDEVAAGTFNATA